MDLRTRIQQQIEGGHSLESVEKELLSSNRTLSEDERAALWLFAWHLSADAALGPDARCGLLHPARAQQATSLRRPGARRIDVPGGPAAPLAARQALDAWRTITRLPCYPDLRLLVSEVVANSVLHAGAGADERIELRLELSKSRLRVQVKDHGPGFDPVPLSPDESSESGRGLVLVDALADRWGVDRNGGVNVWFELDRVEVAAAG